jgi:hypothetical protein
MSVISRCIWKIILVNRSSAEILEGWDCAGVFIPERPLSDRTVRRLVTRPASRFGNHEQSPRRVSTGRSALVERLRTEIRRPAPWRIRTQMWNRRGVTDFGVWYCAQQSRTVHGRAGPSRGCLFQCRQSVFADPGADQSEHYSKLDVRFFLEANDREIQRALLPARSGPFIL